MEIPFHKKEKCFKYRIIKNEKTGRYIPQVKSLFFWENITYYSLNTFSEAERYLNIRINTDNENEKKNWFVILQK